MRGGVNRRTTVIGMPVRCDRSSCTFIHSAGNYEQHALEISTPDGNGVHNSSIFLNTVPEYNELIAKRTEFIIQKQQVSAPNQSIDGAYVVYDNQVKAIAS